MVPRGHATRRRVVGTGGGRVRSLEAGLPVHRHRVAAEASDSCSVNVKFVVPRLPSLIATFDMVTLGRTTRSLTFVGLTWTW